MNFARFEPLNFVTTRASDLAQDCGRILPLRSLRGRGEGRGEVRVGFIGVGEQFRNLTVFVRKRHKFMGIAPLLLFALCLVTHAADAPKVVFPAPCYSSNMVLQKPPAGAGDAPLIWGWADKSLDVVVRIGTNELRAETPWREIPGDDQVQSWVVRYRALAAQQVVLPDGPFDITILSGHRRKMDGPTGTLTNIVAGEVWLVVDPEFDINPAPANSSASLTGDVRILRLNTPRFNVRPAEAGGIVSGHWQIWRESQTQLSNQCAVSSYCLDSLRSRPSNEPVGVLLVSQTIMSDFREYLVEKDFMKLPAKNQADVQFTQPWAIWTGAWRRAGDEWKGAAANFDRSLVLLKRRGQVPASLPPRDPHFGQPSIEAGNLPELEYAIRGILH